MAVVKQWECRYSSCEMMYLDVCDDGDVRMYLDHRPGKADHYTSADVFAGAIDADANNLFGPGTADEVRAAVRERLAPANRRPRH